MRKNLFDTPTNKDVMMRLFVEMINSLSGTKLDWNKMNNAKKAKIKKLANQWHWGNFGKTKND